MSAIADWKPDALLIFGYGYVTHLKLILAPKLNGIPLLFRGDSHELYPKRTWRSWVGRCLRRLIIHRFSSFLAVGKANTHYFLQVGVEPERIFRSPHCVDNERFQQAAPAAEEEAIRWKELLGIPPESPVILFAGKMEQKKCPLELLTAFLNLPKESEVAQKAVLLFVGGGILEQQLRDLAGPEIGKRVFFAPFQNQSAMPKVYATGDVLVLPSYGRGETWGLAVNEAMNMARPAIVSSHCGGSRDLILQGETGWMFTAGNWDELRNTLEMAINDPERLKAMGLAAREHIANFSYDCATKGLLQSLRIRVLEQLPR